MDNMLENNVSMPEPNSKRIRITEEKDWKLNYIKWNSYMNEPMKDISIDEKTYIVNINGFLQIIQFPYLTYRQYINNLSNPTMMPLDKFKQKTNKILLTI
jgi:hypothetical protein